MKKFTRATIALAVGASTLFAGVADANADTGVRVIASGFEPIEEVGPNTANHNTFWSWWYSLTGKEKEEQKEKKERQEQRERQERDREREKQTAPRETRVPDGEQPPTEPGPPAQPTEPGQFRSIKDEASMGTFSANLAALQVVPGSGPSGTEDDYDRKLFPHWELIGTEQTANDWPDIVPRSCDARRATLIRDGHNLVAEAKGCKIHVQEGGGWKDSYGFVERSSGEMRPYKESDKPSGFDIDHIVALGDAWGSGASQWDTPKRQMLANDPLNLSLSDLSANRSKGAQSPETYLPPGEFRCEYVKRYTAVKAKYGLTINPGDHEVLSRTGKECGLP